MSYNVVDQSTGDLEQIAGSILTAIYADSPLGVILPFGGSVAPTGFLICDGSAVSRTTYAALFAVIDIKFGSGDGSTTFNLPSHDFGANLYPNVEAKYIIKAIATALPSDFSQCAIKNEPTTFIEALGVTEHGLYLNGQYDSASTPASNVWSNAYLQIQDKNLIRNGFLAACQTTEGKTNIILHADNGDISIYSDDGDILANGSIVHPKQLYSHESNNETWGQLVQLVAAEVAKYPGILGRLVINLGGGQYRWQSGARWAMFESQNAGQTLSLFTIDLSAFTLYQQYFSVNGGMQFNDLTSQVTSGGVSLYTA